MYVLASLQNCRLASYVVDYVFTVVLSAVFRPGDEGDVRSENSKRSERQRWENVGKSFL